MHAKAFNDSMLIQAIDCAYARCPGDADLVTSPFVCCAFCRTQGKLFLSSY